MSSLKLIAISLGSLFVVGCCGMHPVLDDADMAGSSDAPHGLVASGSGEAKAVPDIARTSLGVEARAAMAQQATAQANASMTAVIAALKQAGVADSDLRTQSFSLNFEQEPVPPPPTAAATPAVTPPTELRGFYRASNMLELTVRKLDQVGELLALATKAGANNVWGISFELEHPEVLLGQARAKAVEQAKANAGELARLTGVKLGRLVSVTENSSSGGPMPMMKTMRAEASDSVPVESGEISVSEQVQLVYALPRE